MAGFGSFANERTEPRHLDESEGIRYRLVSSSDMSIWPIVRVR